MKIIAAKKKAGRPKSAKRPEYVYRLVNGKLKYAGKRVNAGAKGVKRPKRRTA